MFLLFGHCFIVNSKKLIFILDGVYPVHPRFPNDTEYVNYDVKNPEAENGGEVLHSGRIKHEIITHFLKSSANDYFY